jgi:hypothetical protein
VAEIPPEVKEYLSMEDGLARVELLHQHPRLEERLQDPATRQAVLDWLGGNEARQPAWSGLAASALAFVRPGITPDDAPVVRTFLVHPVPAVRRGAFELLLTLYFPDRDREALLMLLHSMLLDADDTVRSAAARYVERIGLAEELGAFLRSWLEAAGARSWADTESYELVNRLTGGGGDR